MSERAIWKGSIRFGKIRVGVKFFPAVEDRTIHFRLLHAPDQTPIQQRMVNPRTGEPVASEDIRRGYLEQGQIVLLEKEELQAIAPQDSREITITRFVSPQAISHPWFDRPYFLGPDGPREPYFTLVQALQRTGRVGFGRWVMRKKSYIGMLRAEAGGLMIMTLRYAGEVIQASELPRPKAKPLEPQEIRMAAQLVQALEGEFDPGAYEDNYRRRVMELIETKARGGQVEFRKPKKRSAKVVSLADMLEASVRQIREQRKSA